MSVDNNGWKAELSLTFQHTGTKTVLGHRKHEGPLRVQRPFYPERDTCHVYILHPPGGVVGGDRLYISVKVTEGSHALLTTPAAGKFYRSSGARALQSQELSAEDGAILEWLPQETIVYNQAQADLVNRIELHGNARFIGWEVLCLGLPASKKQFLEGQVRQSFEVFQDGERILIERGRYEGDSPMLKAHWGLGGCPVSGTLIATNAAPDILEDIRNATQDCVGDDLFGVTNIHGLTVCRYIGQDAYRAHRCFIKAWEVLRQDVLQQDACPPRIWKT
jgi:urease accessory protein